jgi:hypothetical protein
MMKSFIKSDVTQALLTRKCPCQLDVYVKQKLQGQRKLFMAQYQTRNVVSTALTQVMDEAYKNIDYSIRKRLSQLCWKRPKIKLHYPDHDRMISHSFNVTILKAYAPVHDSPDQKKDFFLYNQLQNTTNNNSKTDMLLFAENFQTKTDSASEQDGGGS